MYKGRGKSSTFVRWKGKRPVRATPEAGAEVTKMGLNSCRMGTRCGRCFSRDPRPLAAIAVASCLAAVYSDWPPPLLRTLISRASWQIWHGMQLRRVSKGGPSEGAELSRRSARRVCARLRPSTLNVPPRARVASSRKKALPKEAGESWSIRLQRACDVRPAAPAPLRPPSVLPPEGAAREDVLLDAVRLLDLAASDPRGARDARAAGA